MTNDEEGKDCDNLACQAELMRERGETADSRPGLWPAESQQEANQDRGEEREREREREDSRNMESMGGMSSIQYSHHHTIIQYSTRAEPSN